MLYSGQSNEVLQLTEVTDAHKAIVTIPDNDTMIILWSTTGSTELLLDGRKQLLTKHQITFLTGLHHISVLHTEGLRTIRFNRSFYCVINHDAEVGCKGILFYGATQIPSILIPDDEREKYDILWRMFVLEMNVHDGIQAEMLQMMLKRFIILCVRLTKQQNNLVRFDSDQLNLIREFNFLVELHFREKHTVAEYATLLHKSPKTLANLFARYNTNTPLQIIHERILMEARRLLVYTDLSVKEVGYQLGFDSLQSFSRFFKKCDGDSPLDFREKTRTALHGKN
jgi:AraC family transcriptional regulator, transcriptional activator of pobA